MRKTLSVGALVVGVLLVQVLNLAKEHSGWGEVQANPLSGTQAEILGVYFTPPVGAASAIAKTIDASQREILVQAYGFTHNAIAQAILRAKAQALTER